MFGVVYNCKNMMTKKQRDDRAQKIRSWNKDGKTQEFIAEQLGLTRQRVQQLEQELGLIRGRARGKKMYKRVCEYTGETFETTKPDQKYKDREAFLAARRNLLTPEKKEERDAIRKEKNRLKARNYYHNVFKKRADWKKIVKKRNQKQYAAQSTNKA